MRGPMTREERRELNKERIDDIEWENEESLVLGERKNPDSNYYEPDERWAFTRDLVTRGKGRRWWRRCWK